MDYEQLECFLSKKIEHASVEIIGQSVLKRYIYAVSFNFSSDYTVIIQSAMHAREYITCDLAAKLILDLSRDFDKYKEKNMPNVIFVPMVNPDGVEISHYGLKSVKNLKYKRFLKTITENGDFEQFKANANGVDLNNNFDARWGRGKESRLTPFSHGYIGECPMSEPEVQALSCLTLKVKPFFTISYHSKGEEIYYEFFNKKENINRDTKIAKLVAKTLKYKIVNCENVSAGGYKDWCILRLNIPSVTIEVGSDKLSHPIKPKALKDIYKRNKNILKVLPKILKEYQIDRLRKVHEAGSKGG